MKKSILLILGLFLAQLTGFAGTVTITNSGNTFTPSTLTVDINDDIFFDISSNHNAVEVSQTTYNANGNTPLPNGFSVPYGGGTIQASTLGAGDHYYVCTPHAGLGMKGTLTITINVHIDIEALDIATLDCQQFLIWEVTDESKLDYYTTEVAQSASGPFEILEKIPAQNTTHYKVPLSLPEGEHYVRLGLHALSGETTYTAALHTTVSCTVPKEVIVKHDIASPHELKILNTQKEDKIKIIDLMGRVIHTSSATDHSTYILLADHYMGNFIVTLTRKGTPILTQKISVL